MSTIDNSQITLHKGGGVSVTGRDAMSLYLAITLRSSIVMWQRTGLIPTRGVTITRMLQIATEYTGKTYKRSQVDQCVADLNEWIGLMKSGMPVRDERDQQEGA